MSRAILNKVPLLVCALWLPLTACNYDLGRLERAAAARDAGEDGDADAADGDIPAKDAGPEVPEDLIELFKNEAFYSDGCRNCARESCEQANEACHEDPECEAVTACFARENTPRNQAECREEHRAWFVEHMNEIDVGGPFFDCVFWRDCKSQCGADRNLSCVGEYRWSSAENGAKFEVALLLQEALTLEAAKGAQAKACRIEDLDCTQPSQVVEADKNGRVDLELPAPRGRFTGYVEITGAGLAPTLLVFGWPIATADARRVPIVSETTLALQMNIGGTRAAEDSGMVQVRVLGCNGVGTKDVRVEVQPSDDLARIWYFREPLPTFDADATFANGNAGIVNVAPGVVDIVGTLVPDEKEVVRWPVPVRADHLTILLAAPLDR